MDPRLFIQLAAMAIAAGATIVVARRRPRRLPAPFGPLRSLGVAGLLVLGLGALGEAAWAARALAAPEVSAIGLFVWSVVTVLWAACHLVAAGFAFARRRWALALGIFVCAGGIVLGVTGSITTLITFISLGEAAFPVVWVFGGLIVAAPYLVVGVLLVLHDRDPLAVVDATPDAARPVREHGAFSAAILAGAAFMTVGWVMYQTTVDGEMYQLVQGTAHLIGAAVALVVAAALGYRHAGQALTDVPARSLALRLTIEGTLAGTLLTTVAATIYSAAETSGNLSVWMLISVPGAFMTAVPGAALVAFPVSIAWVRFMRSRLLLPPLEEPAG